MKKHTTTIAAQNALECILSQKTVSFYPVFAKAFGSVPAAVMLSQGLFWQYKAKHGKPAIIDNEEYFAKTVEEWYEETSITESAQKLARSILVKHGVFKEKLAGLPAKMHFRVDIESVVAVINGYLLTGVSVAVKHGNKERQLTRTGSGKFRQQEAVKDGGIIIESLESSETTTERGIDVAVFDSEVNALVIDSIPLEAEKEKDTPSSAAPLEKEKELPAARPTPGESAPRRYDAFDMDQEAEAMKQDYRVCEKFAIDLGNNLEIAKGMLPGFIDSFVSDQKAVGQTYNNRVEFRKHFFNLVRKKQEIKRSSPAAQKPFNQTPSVLPRSLQNKVG